MRTGKGRPLTPFRFPTHCPSGKHQPEHKWKGTTWSVMVRAKRAIVGKGLCITTDPGGVADQIPSCVNSSATAAAVGYHRASATGGRSLRSDRRLPYVSTCGDETRDRMTLVIRFC